MVPQQNRNFIAGVFDPPVASRILSVLDDACLQDCLTAELQLPFYRLTEAIRIEEANLEMYRMRPIVPLTEPNATYSQSTAYSGEVHELDHDYLDRLVQSQSSAEF